jgi:hypothetical protein
MKKTTISLKNLKPFQVDPERVDRQEIAKLVDKISINSKVSEIQGIFDQNISLCAHLLKHGYIDYHKIYFLSTSLFLSEANRPDYLCACYHAKKGVSWYAIICAGSQEQTWDDDLQLTPVAKKAFDKLNFCTSNLEKSLLNNKLVEEVDSDRIHGLLIIGQDREFFRNRKKQERKRDINQTSSIKLRTYGAFLRKFDRAQPKNWLKTSVNNLLDRFRKSD